MGFPQPIDSTRTGIRQNAMYSQHSAVTQPSSSSTAEVRSLYMDLLELSLTGALVEDSDMIWGGWRTKHSRVLNRRLMDYVGRRLRRFNIEVATKLPYNSGLRINGLDLPERSASMIGMKRMENLRHCIESVIADDVPGDLIETGVWRGGACIFMRGVLRAYNVPNRRVWVADSFQGVPPPNIEEFPQDTGDRLHEYRDAAPSLDGVRDNFRRYGLLDENVRFLPGWFKDTLPNAPISEVAVMRLDGDIYESTIQSLRALYPKLSTGGYCIIDDFGLYVNQAQRAVLDYRAEHGITAELVDIDGVGTFWRK